MKETTAPTKTPSPKSKPPQTDFSLGKTKGPRAEFMAAALTMSWQLAIVVLVPIVGGFELDKKLKSAPVLTIVGFFLALAGMSLVVRRQLELFTPPPIVPKTKGHRP
jgi:F0F1-type ATP synthase assembly protein I